VTTLYRLYDNAGALLYVGIAEHWPTRMKQHARERAWWEDVAEVRLERHHDRASAQVAEVIAIQAEGPKHNIAHARPRRERTDRRYTEWLRWQSTRLDLDPDDPHGVADAWAMHATGRVPAAIVVRGRIHEFRLIVDPCPLCGRKHTHGWLGGEGAHGVAFRMPHCHPAPKTWQRIEFVVPDQYVHRGHPGPPMYDPHHLDEWERTQRLLWGLSDHDRSTR